MKKQKALLILLIPKRRVQNLGRGQYLTSLSGPVEHPEAAGCAVAGLKPVMATLLHPLPEGAPHAERILPAVFLFIDEPQAADSVGRRRIFLQCVLEYLLCLHKLPQPQQALNPDRLRRCAKLLLPPTSVPSGR